MDFGISCSRLDDLDLVREAEQWGYDFCWATDSPLLRSNPWVILALAAQRTQRIRLGMGVAVPGLRLAPDTATGIATINRLAPGRTFLGIGTGNTAMRTLGRRPMRVQPFADYVAAVKGLLAGDEVPFPSDISASDGNVPTHPIRLQNLDRGYVDIEPPIPVYVGGFGPRAQRLAGAVGDGLITGIPRGGTVVEALHRAREGAASEDSQKADGALGDFYTTALVNMVLLEPGETLRSQRVIDEVGSSIMVNIHYLVERHKETGEDPPEYVLPIWDEYLQFHRQRDAAHSHQQMHASHYSYLEAGERRFITPQIIETFCLAGQPETLIERLRDLETQGLDAIAFIPPDDQKEAVYSQFAQRVIGPMRST